MVGLMVGFLRTKRNMLTMLEFVIEVVVVVVGK